MFIEGVSRIADLHTHLMGCGDWQFWRSIANASHNIYLTGEDLYSLGIPLVIFDYPISVPELAKRLGQSSLRDLFEMRCPSSFSDFEERFFLRKLFIKNNPEILADLIETESRKQSEAGVSYVEYSLGGELLEERYRKSILKGVVKAEQLGVHVRFLAAFKRRDSHLVWHGRAMVPDNKNDRSIICKLLSRLEEGPHEEVAWMEGQIFTDGYVDYEDQLKRLNMLDSLLKNEDSDSKGLSRLIVGLDLMGFEDGCPWVPFVERSFQDWIKRRRNEQPNFGVRIHLSEGISPVDDYGFSHLRIGLKAVFILLENVGCPVRIGHGLGTIFMPVATYLKDHSGSAVSDEKRRSRAAKETFFREFRRLGWEMNISSNYLLQSYTGTRARNLKEYAFLHPVSLAMYMGFPVTLGSDDGGIFRVSSVRQEYELVLGALRLDPDNYYYAKLCHMSERRWLAYHMSLLACSGFSLAFASEEDREKIPGFDQTQLITHIRNTVISPRACLPGVRILSSLPRFMLDP